MMLSAVLGIVGALLTIAKFVWGAFSPQSRLHRLQLWIERQRTATDVEANRVADEAKRIDAEPDKTGQALIDDLNSHFKDK